jgi:hypothetical protein
VGAGARPGDPARDAHAAVGLRLRHLRPQRRQPRGLQGAGERGREPGAGLRASSTRRSRKC